MDELTLDYDRIKKWIRKMHSKIAKGACGAKNTFNNQFIRKYAMERLSMMKISHDNRTLLNLYFDDVKQLVQSGREGIAEGRDNSIYAILLYTQYNDLMHKFISLHDTMGIELERISFDK